MKKKKFFTELYFQVLISILFGVLIGYSHPQLAIKMRPLGDGFIKLVKMMITPIIFTTVVSGIAGMKNIREAGRIGIKTIIYFECITTLSLLIGLIIANLYHPGMGMNIDVNTIDKTAITNYVRQSSNSNTVTFLLSIIPDTLISAFTKGDVLSILLIAILFGFGLLHAGEKVKFISRFIDLFSTILFSITGFIMKLAPIGVFGAIAYTIGAYGIHTLFSLSQLLIAIYITSFLFIFIVLNLVCKLANFSLWHFLSFIKEELLIVLSTSSSEVVLPQMINKLEQFGCAKRVVRLVLPTGYTFNLDGTSIYLTISALFIAQAFNIDLTLSQQLSMVALLLLTSKGAAAVTGGGFLVLAATLSTLPSIPLEGLALLLGIDRFMDIARSITNLIGNGIATVVIAKWEGDFNESTNEALIKKNKAMLPT
ncbi:C4-dicarboxylate transporter DctA [Legionella gresilensis]|uniref:C4-dicarboxylate transporter DctA n=1 Tax=Legionella gresilensis TaxID=91823 RepID=UPI001A94B631|nr:C4-dicarboxylate transporter DctA [Legionella gresilensis]